MHWTPTPFLLLVSLLSPLGLDAAPQIDSIYGPLPVFEFHSGFWINLHHTLYQEAKQKSATPPALAKSATASRPTLTVAPGVPQSLSPAEQRAWDAALAYYSANFIGKDLLVTTELILLKNQLGDFEDCDEISGRHKKTCDAGLPASFTQILEAAAPVYRTHEWAAQDRANRRWVESVAPLVREQGLGLSERLADIYQTRWPRTKIRVDVSGYANASGAYTTLEPLRVTISSADLRNQGNEALEVLFHEASHGIAEPVQAAIIRECHQREKAIPRDLWHALIFYTTGEVIRPLMTNTPQPTSNRNSSIAVDGYTPYAVREGLYARGWDDYLKLLTRFWQPYLDGRSTFDDSIAHIVSAL